MNLKIINEKENSLYSRKEIVIEIKKEIIPKTTEMEALLSEKFSVPVETIKVNKISAGFGSDIFTIHAKIYKSKEEKEAIEPRVKNKSKNPVTENK